MTDTENKIINAQLNRRACYNNLADTFMAYHKSIKDLLKIECLDLIEYYNTHLVLTDRDRYASYANEIDERINEFKQGVKFLRLSGKDVKNHLAAMRRLYKKMRAQAYVS